MNFGKYKRQYFMPPTPTYDWVKKEYIDKAPIWCSVDLRDGNQALEKPMNLDQKIKFFQYLVKIGFKEIEVGFPAASETEYLFCRTLIEQNLIPDDVTIQVLTQSREHIIRKTFEALKGVNKAVVHLYNSTSTLQRDVVFNKSKEEIIDLAVFGAKLVDELAEEYGKEHFMFEYSPESFSGTELDYAVEISDAVFNVWKPTPDKKVILNLPNTVEMSTPNVYADQIEYVATHLQNRENVIISLHAHNDRGCGVAASELGLLAGADRIEGTLFGNGERTGNADIMVMALNMFSQGIDPKLDFSQINEAIEIYESSTGMDVHPRHPYAGDLVYTAFSGSHQDAIKKGMAKMAEHPDRWEVPYLPIDPIDVGRNYDPIIRINSQSGKGGVAYVLEHNFGMIIPKKMREDLGYAVKDVSDVEHKELTPNEVLEIFEKRYKKYTPVFKIKEVHFKQQDGIQTVVTIEQDGKQVEVEASGNGRLDAVSNALENHFGEQCHIMCYEEHALKDGSDSSAIAYVGIKKPDGTLAWGAGVDADIIKASIDALVTAINNR